MVERFIDKTNHPFLLPRKLAGEEESIMMKDLNL
jgi:hypothetical protein